LRQRIEEAAEAEATKAAKPRPERGSGLRELAWRANLSYFT